MIKFGDTKEKFLEAINTALARGEGEGNGNGIYQFFTQITDQYVRVWDLGPGVYEWTYRGQKYLYYNGDTDTTVARIGSDDTYTVYLEITTGYYDVPLLFFKAEVGTIGTRYIYYGFTDENYGEFYSRNFNRIPTGKELYLVNSNGVCSLEQSFMEGGEKKGSAANGKYGAAFNQNNKQYQRSGIVHGGGNEVGLTVEEFNERYPNGTDEWGLTYDKSNSYANAGGETNKVKGRGSHIGGGKDNEVHAKYAGVNAGGKNIIAKESDYAGINAGYNGYINGKHSGILDGNNVSIEGENSGGGGFNVEVKTDNTHAFGSNLKSNKRADAFLSGKYNNENSYAIHQVGVGYVDGYGNEIRRNSFEVFDDGTVQSNIKAKYFGEVDFTDADVIGLSNTGSGFTELTKQYVRVWDLEPGIYKWTYNGQKYLYYNGATGTEDVGIGNSFNLDVYLEITSIPATKIIPEMKSFAVGTNIYTVRSQSRYLVYGMTSAESGSYQIRDYANFPTSTPVTLLGEQTITGNKTFTGKVDFTKATVTGISTSGGGEATGSGIPTLTTQTVNLADLEAGIYRWEYSVYIAEEDGYDTTKTLLVGDSTCILYSEPVFLQVHKVGNEVSFEAIDNESFGYDETHRVIYYGGMHLEDGDGYWNRRALNNIPEEYIDTTQIITKTKITVAELKSYIGDYRNHFGKMVQLVFKGSNSNDSRGFVTRMLGNFTIDSNVISLHDSYADASQSDLSGFKCSLNIGATYAYIEYYSWTFDFASTSLGQTQRYDITDTTFDIYIIG